MCTAAQQHHCKFKVFRVLHRSTLQWIVLNISDVNLHLCTFPFKIERQFCAKNDFINNCSIVIRQSFSLAIA